MAAAYESHDTDMVTADADTQLVFDKPTGLAEGDLLLWVLGSVSAVSTPSGWTALWSDASGTRRLFVFAKEADGTDVAAATFSIGVGGFSNTGGYLMRVSGANFATLVATAQEGVNAQSVSAPNIFTQSDDNLVIWGVHQASNNTSYTTNRGTSAVPIINQATPAVSFAAWYEVIPTAGAVTGAFITKTNFGVAKAYAIEIPPSGGSPPVVGQPTTKRFGGVINSFKGGHRGGVW